MKMLGNYEQLFPIEEKKLKKYLCVRDVFISLQAQNENSHKMKDKIHPENYRLVVFRDMGTGNEFLCRSCASSKENAVFEGNEYPLVKLDISRFSHPFFTGKHQFVDTAGRVDKFKNRYAKHISK